MRRSPCTICAVSPPEDPARAVLATLRHPPMKVILISILQPPIYNRGRPAGEAPAYGGGGGTASTRRREVTRCAASARATPLVQPKPYVVGYLTPPGSRHRVEASH